ncbi:N-formylglutamate amidohydrolase [Celeribacter marinus]|uniref:N-formylglutamate amidohydrolase n=1 Tax=Celeribacter marinus TaxID=1397108 RepID=UPI003F6D8876
MSNASYLLKRPTQRTSSVVFSSPHSGRNYPKSFVNQSVLDPLTLRSSEDAFVDLLFEGVTDFGVPMISAVFPRAWVDLNRRCDEFDPALIEGMTRGQLNPRVASGLGVVPRVVAGGRNIYSGKLTRDEVRSRIELFWKPYHGAMKTLLNEAHALYGQSILLDCHSMPREALASNGLRNVKRPEIVIGDRYGASADPSIVAHVESAFIAEGFLVTRNMPFAGAYIVEQYGRPAMRRHAIQIEIDRSLYMHEARIEPRSEFNDVREALLRAARRVVSIDADDVPLAAE